MERVDVNNTVHTMRFHVRAIQGCVRRCTWMGTTPILCDCDMRFKYEYITHRIAPCEQNDYKSHTIQFLNRSRTQKKSHRVNEPLRLRTWPIMKYLANDFMIFEIYDCTCSLSVALRTRRCNPLFSVKNSHLSTANVCNTCSKQMSTETEIV